MIKKHLFTVILTLLFTGLASQVFASEIFIKKETEETIALEVEASETATVAKESVLYSAALAEPFITTWKTDNPGDSDDDQITIPTTGGGYNYDIYWEDVTNSAVNGTLTGQTGEATITFPAAGTYRVEISGDFPQIDFSSGDDNEKILTIEQWGDIEWRSMAFAFWGATNLTSNATDAPDLTNVTDLSSMFDNANSFNGDLSSWDVSNVTNMYGMFSRASSFDGDLSSWDVSNVTNMFTMFSHASAFNGDLSSWDVSSVTNIADMFGSASSFNGDLSSWDVSSVEFMHNMFNNATSFNGDLSSWDVSSVTNMSGTFNNATSFNGDLSSWDVSSVTHMQYMFNTATSFNGDLSSWDVSSVTHILHMLDNSGLSTENYDKTLIGWEDGIVQNDVTLGAEGLEYCSAANARQELIDAHNWTITGDTYTDSCIPKPFITTWKTDNPGDSDDDQITIPTTGGGYNYDIYWEDVTNSSVNGTLTGQTGEATITFPAAGIYRVEMSGDFPQIYFSNTGDKEKILTIEQWGDIEWRSMAYAFDGASNLTSNASDVPDLTNVTDMTAMFQNASSFNGDLSSWNVSNITNMTSMFFNNAAFNSDLSSWDVSKVTNMFAMFTGASSFNGDLSSWNVSSVTNMNGMFNRANTFNVDLSRWDVSNVTDMMSMFNQTSSFNGDLSTWNVSNVTNMNSMFYGATSFNGDLSSWDVSRVTNMSGMLDNSGLSTENYDKTLIGWEDGIVQNDVTLGATGLEYCSAANARQELIDAHNWTITGDTYTDSCIPKPFITTWKTDNPGDSDDDQITIPTTGGGYNYDIYWEDVTNSAVNGTLTGQTGEATITFPAAGTYRVEISGDFPQIDFSSGDDNEKILTIEQWGDIEWRSMAKAFVGASNLTYNATDAPDLSGVSNLQGMFANASSFNGDLSSWDVSSVTDLNSIFSGASSFNGDLSSWNVSSVTSMASMFYGASSFNGNLSSWDVNSVTDMSSMFVFANSFNGDLSSWDVSSVTSMGKMLDNSGLSTENYDKTLIGWEDGIVQNDVTLGAAGLEYCSAANARQELIDAHNWTITGDTYTDSCIPKQFITTWKTDNPGDSDDDQITIPTTGGGYNYDIYWEDVTNSAVNGTLTGQTGEATITFPAAGTYRVEISGDFPQIDFSSGDDNEKILTIEQWGDIEWRSMAFAFWGATNLTSNATDAPDLTNVTDLSSMFDNANSFNGDLSSWDVSNVTNMYGMFSRASSFDGDLSSWDVSNVTNMFTMFSHASAFNGDLSSWDVSSVTNIAHMFGSASSFNGDLSSWDVSSVEFMHNMFTDATSFNGDLSSWDVSSVTNMSGTFNNATSFNGDLSSWDVSSVTRMQYMFNTATSFNGDLSSWDVSSVTHMLHMLDNSGLSTENYDKTLIGWEDGSVQNDVTLGAEGLEYCSAANARQELIDAHNWTITDKGLAGGCTSPEGEDQRILVSNASDYEFSKDDFGVSNDNYFIKIETLPNEGTLLLDGNPVNLDDEISIVDINSSDFTWDMPDGEYGYNFTLFEFRILDDNDKLSDNPYILTIDLGNVFTELSGSEGWRFMTNPSGGDSYFDLFSGVTVEIGPPPSQSLYELDQENYEWDPVGSTGDEPGIGTPFTVYLLAGDLPVTLVSGDNWDELDGTFSYNGLDYDGNGSSSNPGNFYLLGNPHPIALDFCEFTSTDIATSVYFWDPNANGGNGTYIVLNCAAPDNIHIAPFQSFWVRTTGNTPELSVPEAAYLGGTVEGYFKESSNPTIDEPEDLPLISLQISSYNEEFTGTTRVLFTDQATESLDRFDAPKLSAEGLAQQWLSFYSLDTDGRSYAFQSLPATMLNKEKIRVPLGVQTTEVGRFMMDWTLPETKIFNGSYYLRDNQTGEVIELHEEGTYIFEIESEQAVKVSADERSAKFLGNFADLDNSDPRFELLIAASGIDGLTELGAVPEDFTLAQNYPNPFNPTTVISYQLPVSSEVSLEVYDMLGRNVGTLVSGQVSAGRHTVNFDASNLSSGVYLYRLQAGSQIMTKKLTIMK